MRLLHTADWHVGKSLRGVSRLDEQRRVLDEVVGIAAAEGVDVVVVAGDVFESAAPTAEAQELAWATLLALRATGAEVIVVAGNHDPADAFDALAPVFAGVGIHVVGRPRRPADGGVVERCIARTGELVRLALLPFVSQRGVVRAGDLLALHVDELTGAYRARLAAVLGRLTERFTPDAVNVVVAHATLVGGRMGGGEREAQSIFDYAVDALAFPASASYVALGHLHRCQQLPARCPVWYSGSPIAVDFGEVANEPGVLVVDAAPGRPAAVRTVALTAARRLRRVQGTVAELRALAADVGDDLLSVVVTEPGRAGLADEVRAILPHALEVRVAAASAATVDRPAAGPARSPQELFQAYLSAQGVDDARLESLFAELLDAALEPGGAS